jgi:hypothetical protein
VPLLAVNAALLTIDISGSSKNTHFTTITALNEVYQAKTRSVLLSLVINCTRLPLAGLSSFFVHLANILKERFKDLNNYFL